MTKEIKSSSVLDLNKLQHTCVEIEGGGEVIVLDTGASINAEASAMLQALYSRSVESFRDNIKVLVRKGPDGFMKTFYVGYGHDSIGDNGTVVIFIEDVSMLAAKAVQDWPLYSGQEASTRYIDFAKQPFRSPAQNKLGEEILENWRQFYVKSMPLVIDDLKARFPCRNTDDKNTWAKAINARAFDILRSVLPAGATTKLAWTSNIRQVRDKLTELRHHPLEEVRNIAHAVEQACMQACPNSFDPLKREKGLRKGSEMYMAFFMKYYYLHFNPTTPSEVKMQHNGIDRKQLLEYKSLFQARPNGKTLLPRKIANTGTVRLSFALDFGSYRDIQRHRAVFQEMPLLTTRMGFEKWYIQEMPSLVASRLGGMLLLQNNLLRRLQGIGVSDEKAQYYIPMGYKCPMEITGSLPAIVYLVELRSGTTVHATLRLRATEMGELLEQEFKSEGLKLFIDKSETEFDVKRGEHDIVKVA